MRVLVTGVRGYLGPIIASALASAGHEVFGLDSGLFADCVLEPSAEVPTLEVDLRNVDLAQLQGFDGIVHLANLSNDPLGMLDPGLTYTINVEATVRLARLARQAGVRRFVNSSSCSVYGAATESWVDELTVPRPVTAYGETKLQAEQQLAELADADFCVVSLRNATAFGYSPRLRLDLVVNDLVASAHLWGEVRLASDGSAWRPLVHVRDITQAFVLALEAPAERINQRVVNVGTEEQNYRIIDVAQAVVAELPGSRLVVPETAGADRRSYRVRFERIRQLLPAFRCAYDLQRGIRELRAAYQRAPLVSTGPFIRLQHLRDLMDRGRIDGELRFVAPGEVLV